MGDSLQAIRGFPDGARRAAGFQIERLQRGLDPDDWKPMTSVGVGVREIRVREPAGVFRVIYVTKLTDAIVVLHAFQKTTERTAKTGRGLGSCASEGSVAEHIEMTEERFGSVWDAIESSPADAAAMRARADLMMAIREVVDGWTVTPAEAARRLGITRSSFDDLVRGKIDKFSLEALVKLAAAAGLTVRLEVAGPAA